MCIPPAVVIAACGKKSEEEICDGGRAHDKRLKTRAQRERNNRQATMQLPEHHEVNDVIEHAHLPNEIPPPSPPAPPPPNIPPEPGPAPGAPHPELPPEIPPGMPPEAPPPSEPPMPNPGEPPPVGDPIAPVH